MKLKPKRKSELLPEFLSTLNLNPYSGHDSASRKQMFAGNMPQTLSLLTPTRRMAITGMEREYAKYCFMVKMDYNVRIIEIVNRISSGASRGSVAKNPERYVIYEVIDGEKEGEVGFLILPTYKSLHKRFGFEYVYDKEMERELYAGNYIKAGTVFARPATISKYGEYMYGREARIAFMTLPGVIEDGAIVSESFANAMATNGYEERVVNYGSDVYPLNLYGRTGEYKAFPDVGERVREDGLVMVLRAYDETTAAVQMTPDRLTEIDRVFDKPVYGTPGAEVVDVIIHHKGDGSPSPTPVGMEYSASRYDQAQRRFYSRLIEIDAGLDKTRGKNKRISRDFHRLVAEGLNVINPARVKRKVGYRRQELDDYRVTIVLKEKIVPGMGIKITDTHGGKGVICKVMRDEDMPRDQYGNIMDLVMDPMSLTKRMNIGRVIEPRINSCSMMLTREVREAYGFPDVEQSFDVAETTVAAAGLEKLTAITQRLIGYYGIVSPRMAEAIAKAENFNWRTHIATVLSQGVQLWLPTDNPVEYVDVVQALRGKYEENLSYITFRGEDGTMKTTKKKMVVGSIYIILLEKIGRDFAAVASAKLQINGVPSRISSNDRNSNPVRPQPVRIAGETEVRLFLMAIGGLATRDLLDQTNNPESHRLVIGSIMDHENPTDIESVIDRLRHPMTDHRIMQQIKHLHECGGIEHVLINDSEPAYGNH